LLVIVRISRPSDVDLVETPGPVRSK